MKTQTYNKLAVSAAILMSWTWLTALQCGDASGPPITVQGCSVHNDPDFPITGNVSLNIPAHCPVGLTGNTYIPYAATADLPSGSVSWQFYQNQIITWNGYQSGFVANTVWSQGTSGRWMVNITGNYVADQGGFDPNNAGSDSIKNGFYANHWTYATTIVTYAFGSPTNNLDAPSTVAPDQSYSVSASTNDPLLTSPVTWSWYVDGSLAGTTSDPQFTVTPGGSTYNQQVEVVATDGNGHSVSGSTTVYVTSGCDRGFTC
jgi:hypothetical protein